MSATISYEDLMRLKAINKAITIGGTRINIESLGAVLADASTVRDGYTFEEPLNEIVEWCDGALCHVIKTKEPLRRGENIDIRADIILTIMEAYKLVGITPVAATILAESCRRSGFERRLMVNAITKYRTKFYNEGVGVRSAWGLLKG